METSTFHIHGLDCADEVAVIRQALGKLGLGEDDLSFDLLNGRVVVRAPGDGNGPDDRAILKAIAAAGMRSERLGPPETIPETSGGDEPLGGCGCCGSGSTGSCASGRTDFWTRRGRAVMSGISGVLLVLGGVAFFLPPPPPLDTFSAWLWAAGSLAGLWHVAPAALRAALRLRADMNLLMTGAVIGAGLLGDWFEAASTAFLFSFALLLETWTVSHARRSIQALLDIAPRMARVVIQDLNAGRIEIETPVESIRPGSLVIVRPGEIVPLDGVVAEGETEVSEAPLTGEPAPVYKGPGSEIYAGTVNGDGVVSVRVSKAARDTALSRIMRMVREAQSRKAALSRWVDRFAAVYTPAMIFFALGTAMIPPLLGQGTLAEWTRRGLVVLVASCPCALAISTPVSFVAALSAAVRRGVLIKGGAYLESAAGIEAVAFDKTGTLTTGELRVGEAIPAEGVELGDLLGLAGVLEAGATHPAGRAIHTFATTGQSRPVRADLAVAPKSLPGLGMQGEVGGTLYYAGSPRLYERITGRALDMSDWNDGPLGPAGQDRKHRAGDLPQAVVFSASGPVGAFFLEDSVRPESRRTVEALKGLGVRHVAMLTGDAAPSAGRVGGQAGVDAVHPGLMPEDKVTLVRDLSVRYGRVAMVGDGVNDAPALAAADLGIAMGAIGTGAAIETADIALMSDDLDRLPWLIGHARRTLAIVRWNVIFALGVKVLFILMALTGAATLWMAVVADMGTSLLVIGNGLRLLGSPAAPRSRG